jgi:hypothetical protein
MNVSQFKRFDSYSHPIFYQEAIQHICEIRNNPEKKDNYADVCREMIYKLFQTNSEQFEIIFTPDRSESNTALIYMTALSYRKRLNKVGHILISDSEHIDLINTCKCLQSYKLLEYDILKSNEGGLITKDNVSEHVKNNTCLISISHMSDRGIISPINKIGQFCHEKEVPFHSDVSYTFGIFPLRPNNDIDVFTISFDQIGCPGSALILRKDFIRGYNMVYMIPRSTPTLVGITYSIKKFLTNRKEKTKSIFTMGPKLMTYISKKINIIPYENYDDQNEKMLEIVLFNEIGYHILFSVVNDNFDNQTLIDYLRSKKIHINSAEKIYSLPRLISKGLIRISFHEGITEQDIRILANEIIKGIQLQISKAEWEDSKVKN